ANAAGGSCDNRGLSHPLFQIRHFARFLFIDEEHQRPACEQKYADGKKREAMTRLLRRFQSLTLTLVPQRQLCRQPAEDGGTDERRGASSEREEAEELTALSRRAESGDHRAADGLHARHRRADERADDEEMSLVLCEVHRAD